MKSQRCAIGTITILCILFFSFYTLYPNGGPVEMAGGNLGTGHVELIRSDQIEIKDEKLTIDLCRGYADVKVVYTMHNSGKATTVKLGFPSLFRKHSKSGYTPEETEIQDYSIVDGGKELPSKVAIGAIELKWIKLPPGYRFDFSEDETPHPIVGWFVSEIAFKEGETKNISISYLSRYLWSASADNVMSPDIFRYIVSTGATWKGPIKSGSVQINAKAVGADGISLFPKNRFARKGSSFYWSFQNLEPASKDNILIDMNNDYLIYYSNGYDSVNTSILNYKNKQYEIIVRYANDDRVTIKASSVLQETCRNDNCNHNPSEVLFDQNSKTAWAEGKEGDGVGEYLLMTLKNASMLQKIGIMNGLNLSKKYYLKNNRVAGLEVTLNGDYTKKVTLSDSYTIYDGYNPNAFEFIDVSDYKKSVKTIKLTILSVYRGTEFRDTCVSEIMLLKRLAKMPEAIGR